MLPYDRSRPVLMSRFRGAPLCRIGVGAPPGSFCYVRIFFFVLTSVPVLLYYDEVTSAAEPPRVEKPAKLDAAAMVLLMMFLTTTCVFVPALAAVALRFFDGFHGARFETGALRFSSAYRFLQ